MEITVRPSEESDASEVVALMGEAEREAESQRGGAALVASIRERGEASERFRAALEHDDSIVWTATWNQLTVGYALAEYIAEARLVTLSEIFTTREAREVGVGEALLASVLEWATHLGAVAIDAHALPGARGTKNLFERFGLTARLLTVRRQL